MAQLTEHLSEEELACHDGTPYPFDQIDEEDALGRVWRETRALPLGELFEAIRLACGDVSIQVDSGYRTLAYDEKLYEADRGRGNVVQPQGSQHPKGRALDLVHSRLAAVSFFSAILKAFEEGKTASGDMASAVIYKRLGGIGLYPTFVHFDIRQRPVGDHLAIWGGTRPSNIV